MRPILSVYAAALAAVGFALAISPATLAQEKVPENHLTADIQMFNRGENRDGGLPDAEDVNSDKAAFVFGRARISIGYQRPGLEVKTSFQHQGIWGQAGKGSFGIHEAWAKLNTRGGLFLQVGRMVLAYDDERILGPNDWSMAGITHDVLKGGYEGHGHKVHTVWAYNQNAENTMNGSTYYADGALPYKTMHMLWYHYDLPVAPLGVSLLGLNIGMQAGSPGENEHIAWQQVVGGYVKFNPTRWNVEGSYYRQMGTDEKGSRLDAWMASIKTMFTPSAVWTFYAGYDYLSGDETFAVPKPGAIGLTYHEVLRGFNPIYGSHHKFYGAMDFFYVSTYVNGFTPGLQNAFVGTKIKPIPNLSADFSYHYLAIAAKLHNIGPTLGHEFEMETSWQFTKYASLSCGISYMFGTENMQRLKRASEDGRLFWSWLSLSLTPRILNFSW